ncbi:MAG: hypothetical protein WD067_08220 [Gaiellaceae bacterium]
MPDLYTDELVEAFALPGCPVCRVRAIDERRRLDSFGREGRNDPDVRQRFFDAGGFCREHAWRLHGLGGPAVADLYGKLAERELRGVERRSRRRGRGCPACEAAEAAAERKRYFLVEALASPVLRERYARSEGLCFPDLAGALEQANGELARFLVDDWRERLRQALADEDWTGLVRRYAGDPKVVLGSG